MITKKLILPLLLLISGFMGRLSAEDQMKDCFLHLTFDELKDGVFADSSGSGNDAANRDAETTPGVNGQGFAVTRPGAGVAVEAPAVLKSPLPEFSVDMWIGLDMLSHVCGFLSSGNDGAQPFFLGMNFGRLDLAFKRADGKQIGGRTPESVIKTITRPDRSFYNITATYDGRQARLYVDGKLVIETKAMDPSPLIPCAKPILIGRKYSTESFWGAIDELSMFKRALTPEEVIARYESGKKNFRPAPLVKNVPGTIDGRQFSETGMWKNWMTYYFEGGRLLLNNVGSMTFVVHGLSDIWDIGIMDQHQRRDNFWKEVNGSLRYDVDENALSLKLKGKTFHGLEIEEEMKADKTGDISFQYVCRPLNTDAPTPEMPMRFNLSSAISLRFTGNTESGAVTGSMPDLDSTVDFRDSVEWLTSNQRLGLQLGEGLVYEMRGDRSPWAWLGGWSGFLGKIYAPGFPGWKNVKELPFSFRITLRKDSDPPLLKPDNPRVITQDRRFDFSSLYKADEGDIRIQPVDRDVPIFNKGETVSLQVLFPKSMRPGTMQYNVRDLAADKEVFNGEQTLNGEFWSLQPWIVFTPPERGVYLVQVTASAKDGTELGRNEQEVAICGEIPQPVIKPGELPKMKLVDDVDMTDLENENVFSYSGRAKTLELEGKKYLQTVTFAETQTLGLRHDWIGCRLKIKNPGRMHIVEIDHPDLNGMNMAVNVVEPQNENAPKDKLIAVNRALSGIWTGANLPSDNSMKTTRLVYLPCTSWCVVTCQNIHDRFMPDDPGAAVKAVRIYEIEGELPKLDLDKSNERLIGIFTESGQMALGSFGDNSLRGGNPQMPPKKTFYRDNFKAVENLVKYLRFRGDSVYIYGAVRYRSAQFQSRCLAPDSGFVNGDLVSLMARIFENNGLQMLLGIEANPLINVQRLPEAGVSISAINAGAPSVNQQTCDGEIIGSDYGLDMNPFNPLVQAEYANLASEIGAKYANFPAVAGIAWMTGNQAITCPTLMIRNWSKKEDAKWPEPYQYTYDDETMRQFSKYLGRELPGKPGDDKRYRERFNWIMNNALPEWTSFRCKAMAEMYAKFTDAMLSASPRMEMFVMDDHMISTGKMARELSPLERLRTMCFDPREFRGKKGLNFALLMPDHHEWFDRGRMRLNVEYWLEDSEKCWNDSTLWNALDPENCGVFLHRQFEEKQVYMPPERGWFFPPRTTLAWCNYPQPADRGNLQQFARIMASSTPRLICWMWCDDSIPVGHEQSMQEFASAFRHIPIGRYETATSSGNVTIRKKTDKSGKTDAFYVVNTGGESAPVSSGQLPQGQQFKDAVSGEALKTDTSQQVAFSLKPFEMKVFTGIEK